MWNQSITTLQGNTTIFRSGAFPASRSSSGRFAEGWAEKGRRAERPVQVDPPLDAKTRRAAGRTKTKTLDVQMSVSHIANKCENDSSFFLLFFKYTEKLSQATTKNSI